MDKEQLKFHAFQLARGIAKEYDEMADFMDAGNVNGENICFEIAQDKEEQLKKIKAQIKELS